MLTNDQLGKWDRESFFHPSTHLAQHARGESASRIVKTGKGVFIEDRDGKTLLDAFGGLYCVNVGYGRESIIEAIAEVAPHVRRTEKLVEHVRMRMAQQICGDLAENGVLNVLRLGGRWDLVFQESLKRDANGDVREFDMDPRQLETFGREASTAINKLLDQSKQFAVLTSPEARTYVRMILERLFPSLPVLSHVEIARGVEVNVIGSVG